MRQNKSIQLKAAFLLMVFALNTVVAFACSLGLNMGYNKNHHRAEKVQPEAAHSHSHAPSTKPHHHNKPATHSHDGSAKHSHSSNHSKSGNAVATHQHENSSNDDDCCTNSAIKFQTEDKKLQQSQNVDIKAPVFVAFLSAFLGLDLAPEKATAATIFLVPQFYPPPDIRIAIQSFLI